MEQLINIALVGNPNSGKTSLFNHLTGLNQKVGNFPGVTVDKKSGTSRLSPTLSANIIDLPGSYSLYPRRADEWVAYKVLLGRDPVKPDMVLVVADASNIKRNLLFCSQIIDLKIPVVMALTMMDIAGKNNLKIDIPALEIELGIPIITVNSRKGTGLQNLKKALEMQAKTLQPAARSFIDNDALIGDAYPAMQKIFPGIGSYKALNFLINNEQLDFDENVSAQIKKTKQDFKVNNTKLQAEEILHRYNRIRQVMGSSMVEADPLHKSLMSEKIDKVLLHRIWGYIIMLGVLFFLFQSVFWIAQFPMELIDSLFSTAGNWLGDHLPDSRWADLLINGLLAGLGGIVMFIPQIMILFGLVTIMEDTGYMARISFLTDRLMRKVGLNGKSIMPMISGFACAVPAIMSARNIENKKERLLTILVTPFMSCSARLPVYTILISLVVPRQLVFGFISLPGLVMMAMYVLGIVVAMLVALILKFVVKSKERSYFILELPVYRSPRWKNVFLTMVEKAKVFVLQAGKVIMVISLILWALSSFGPGNKMENIRNDFATRIASTPEKSGELTRDKNYELLQNSYAGHIGRAIEPAIRPLGFDWKIGIALITSFAAREVFVGTMATLYSVGENDQQTFTLKQKMNAATWPDGRKVYTLAACLSLMVFYVLAMQCMSTLAVVHRETKTWKWPLIQFMMMTSLAYVFAFVVYNLFK